MRSYRLNTLENEERCIYDIESIHDNFGAVIKDARKKMGMSQVEFSELCDIDPPSVCYWEQNQRKPDFVSMIRICNALKINMDELMKMCEAN